jgi:hypothetical protein
MMKEGVERIGGDLLEVLSQHTLRGTVENLERNISMVVSVPAPPKYKVYYFVV